MQDNHFPTGQNHTHTFIRTYFSIQTHKLTFLFCYIKSVGVKSSYRTNVQIFYIFSICCHPDKILAVQYEDEVLAEHQTWNHNLCYYAKKVDLTSHSNKFWFMAFNGKVFLTYWKIYLWETKKDIRYFLITFRPINNTHISKSFNCWN